MPKIVEFEALRSCKVTIALTEDEMADLQREARCRYPLTPAQVAYQRVVRVRKQKEVLRHG